ncbi:hypothetical protein GW17_00055990 [Ensete ventricosum]|nr:hypothetical protein GW17_00055990 [Ensete ventricosum]RZR95762.1 hypothetical protein BHM03_00024640 [Ensete ventricosum]
MIVPTKEPKLEDTTVEPNKKDTPQLATRTVITLAGYTNLQKLKIEWFLEQHFVIILIDAKSTHNFMSSKVAAHLMHQKEDYSGFEVKALHYKRSCSQVPAAPTDWPQPVAPCAGGLGRSQLPLCRGPWPQSVAPTGGLAVAGRPSSSLCLLRKRNKNAQNDST